MQLLWSRYLSRGFSLKGALHIPSHPNPTPRPSSRIPCRALPSARPARSSACRRQVSRSARRGRCPGAGGRVPGGARRGRCHPAPGPGPASAALFRIGVKPRRHRGSRCGDCARERAGAQQERARLPPHGQSPAAPHGSRLGWAAGAPQGAAGAPPLAGQPPSSVSGTARAPGPSEPLAPPEPRPPQSSAPAAASPRLLLLQVQTG